MTKLTGTIYIALSVLFTTNLAAQVSAPGQSARDAVMSDARLIESSIIYNEDIMFLSQKARERGMEQRVKELGEKMLGDHTNMLYSMEQLAAAGTGSSARANLKGENDYGPTGALNTRLARVSGPDFDTMWVSNVLNMQQSRYELLTAALATATNSQLKMAIKEALPLMRRHLSELRSLQKYLVRLGIQKKKEEARKAATKK